MFEPLDLGKPTEAPFSVQISGSLAQEDAQEDAPEVHEPIVAASTADITAAYSIPQNYTGPYGSLLEVDTEVDRIEDTVSEE
jgi:hypothetical protein